MTEIGHNRGPAMDHGRGWRRYAWKKARADLMPTLPIEVARRRVRRARELGIDYKAYAGIRAATGRDIVALLFSDNALRLLRTADLPRDRADKLDRLQRVDCLALVHPPTSPKSVASRNVQILRADEAPSLLASWSETRARVWTLKGNLPADGLVVVGETALEREWCAAGRLAGYIVADRFFA